MIKVISPYYLSTPWVSTNTGLTCDSYTLSIYIWEGDKASVPATAEYTTTKENTESSTGTDDTVNISKLVKDFIDFTPQTASATGEIDGVNQVWVKTEVTYVTTDHVF